MVLTRLSRAELKNTLSLITFLINEKNVAPIFGPTMKINANSKAQDLEKIQGIIKSQNYEDYNYGIWFKLKDKNAKIQELNLTFEKIKTNR